MADKKGLDERLRGIKRKRKDGAEIGDEGDFDVMLDDAIEGGGGGGGRGGRGGRGGGRGGKDGPKVGLRAGFVAPRHALMRIPSPQMPRHARDAKYSMGGGGRRSKQNTKESSNDFSGFNSGARGGGGGRGGGRGGGGGGRGGRGGGRGGGGGGQRPGKSRRQSGRA